MIMAYKENYEGKSNIVSLIYTSNKGQRFEKQMLQAINEYREAQDIESEYQWNDDIASFAAIRSQELSQDYSHMRPNGELWDDVLGDYPCLKASEIIYKTPSASCSPYAVLSALKNDKSSKEKILDYQYTDFATNLYYDETNGNYYIDMIFIY